VRNSTETGPRRGQAILGLAVLCATLVAAGVAVYAQSGAGREWNPVEAAPAGAKYVGEEVCATCHVQEAATFKNAEMRRGGWSAAEDETLRTHPLLTLELGPYHYRIVRQGSESIYSVSDGKQTISAPILWGFGKPVIGQTFVLQHDGAYYQGTVTYYTDINGLDKTLGAPPGLPKTLEDAFGQRLPEQDAQACIICHTTGANQGGVFNPEKSTPGVTCEHCHGPGGKHVSAMEQGKVAEAKAAIFNPAQLNAYDLDDFCGACHRSWSMIVMAGITGIRDVRFQPYRLELSTCWNATPTHISCLACHDPHKPLVRDAAFYDAQCLSCHLEKGKQPQANHPGRACPVGTHDCITCHMPRYEIPGSHFRFFDHDIRVVRPGQPYPG
jgi:hypothetical protein